MGVNFLLGWKSLYFQGSLDPNLAWNVRIELLDRRDSYFAKHPRLWSTVIVWQERVFVLIQKRPRIAEMCGVCIPITLLALSAVYGLTTNGQHLQAIAYAAVVASTAIIGAVDDLKRMRGYYKPLLGLLSGLPIIVLGLLYPDSVYNPTLRVPLFGGFHLPVIYPLTIPVAITVTSNTVNMLDPLNGVMAG